jgi:hypothetical protein
MSAFFGTSCSLVFNDFRYHVNNLKRGRVRPGGQVAGVVTAEHIF